MVNWIVENFVRDNGYESLIKEIKSQHLKCYVLDITNHFDLNQDYINNCLNSPTIFQGSIQLFNKLKSETKLYPLGWMTSENYLCSKYYPYFQEFLFNDKHCFVNLPCLKNNKFFFYGTFGKETMIYIRPNSGNKLFTGRILDLQDFDKFFGNDTVCNIKDDDLILLSTPKNIRGEWRYIVTNDKEILGQSTYMYRGQRTLIPSAPNDATALVKNILNVGYYPDPVFTIDICEDNDGNYWLLEINSFTSAGLYEANKSNIVKRVSEIASKTKK